MLKKTATAVAAAAFVGMASWVGQAQDAKPVIAAASAAIGVDQLKTVEYSATGFVPIASANELYKLGINYVIYALTH